MQYCVYREVAELGDDSALEWGQEVAGLRPAQIYDWTTLPAPAPALQQLLCRKWHPKVKTE